MSNSRLIKLTAVLNIILLFIPLTFAQKTELTLKQVGYGATYQDVLIQFSNTGDTTLTDITIYVDGKALKTLAVTFLPGKTIPYSLRLEPGKHLIEARTPEGAYASVEVEAKTGKVEASTTTISSGKTIPSAAKQLPTYLNWVWIVLIVVVAIIVWFVKRHVS